MLPLRQLKCAEYRLREVAEGSLKSSQLSLLRVIANYPGRCRDGRAAEGRIPVRQVSG